MKGTVESSTDFFPNICQLSQSIIPLLLSSLIHKRTEPKTRTFLITESQAATPSKCARCCRAYGLAVSPPLAAAPTASQTSPPPVLALPPTRQAPLTTTSLVHRFRQLLLLTISMRQVSQFSAWWISIFYIIHIIAIMYQ